MSINKVHNAKTMLTDDAFNVLKGIWTSMRYSISKANVDYSYKPFVTYITYDNMGEVDVINKEGEDSITNTLLKIRSDLDQMVCGLVSFPMKMAINEPGKNEQFVNCLMIVSKIGVLDVYMATKKGCDFLSFTVDKMITLGIVDDIETAVPLFSNSERPIDTPFDMDHGYFIVEDSDGFFFQDDDGTVAKLDQINDLLMGEKDKFEQDSTYETLGSDEEFDLNDYFDVEQTIKLDFKESKSEDKEEESESESDEWI